MDLDCPEGCCRLVRHVFENVVPPFYHRPHGIFADWHHHDDTIPCNWDHQIYTHPKPERLATMNITVLGMKDEEEAEYIHNLGFACEHCPLVGNLLDNKACRRNDATV